MSKEINEDTAKRSIIKLESLVKGLVKDATAFVKKNKTNGLTTPALKRKANSLIEDLEDQFKRMKNRWNDFYAGLEDNFEETFLLLEAKFQESQKTSKEALESLHETEFQLQVLLVLKRENQRQVNQKGNLQNPSLLSSRHILYPILLTCQSSTHGKNPSLLT